MEAAFTTEFTQFYVVLCTVIFAFVVLPVAAILFS